MKLRGLKDFGFAVAKRKIMTTDGNCLRSKKGMLHAAMSVVLLFSALYSRAQDGAAGINEANTKVRSYFDAGTNLMYAIGAILGLIGAVKVYQKWNSGDPDTGKVAAAWFGSCVFLVVVATVIRSFFGI
jgi:hypothetical protein